MADPKTEFVLAARDETQAAFAAVTARLGSLKDTANRVKGDFDGLSEGFKRLAAVSVLGFSAYGLADQFRTITNELANLDDAAEKSGASVESLSGVLFALKPSGASLEQITDLTTKLVRSMQAAGDEGQKSAEAFKALGLNTRDAAGNLRDPVEVLKDLADRLSVYRDGANKTAVAQALLGKSGAEFLPLLKDLAEAGTVNAKVTAEQAAAAETFEKELGKLRRESEQLKISFVSDLLPALTDMIRQFREGKEAAGGFWAALYKFGLQYGPDKTPGERVAEITESIKELNAQILREQGTLDLGPFGRGARRRAEENIDRIRSKIAELQRDLDYFAKQNARDQGRDPKLKALEDRGFIPSAPDAPKLTGDIDKAAAEIEKAYEKLQQAIVKSTLEAEKQLGVNRLALLEANHKDGLVSERDYWAQRQIVQQSAYEAERRLIDDQLRRQADLITQEGKKNERSKEYFERVKDFNETAALRNKLDADFAQQSALNTIEKARATKQYENAIRDLGISIAELEGRTAEAATARFDAQTKELRQRLETNGDKRGLAELDTLRQRTVAQAQYNAAREEAGRIESDLKATEERIQATLRTGAISEMEALRQTQEARQNSVVQLKAIEERMAAIAAESGNPQLKANLGQFSAQLETLKSQSDLLREKFATIGEEIAGKFLDDITSGTTGAAKAFENLANIARRELNRLIAADFRSFLLTGSASKGGLFETFGRLFGLGGGGSVAGSGGSTAGSTAVQGLIPEAGFDLGAAVLTKSGNQGGRAIYVTNHYDLRNSALTSQFVEQAANLGTARALATMTDGRARGSKVFS